MGRFPVASDIGYILSTHLPKPSAKFATNFDHRLLLEHIGEFLVTQRDERVRHALV